MSQVYLGTSSTPSVPTSFVVKVAGVTIGTAVPVGNILNIDLGYTSANNINGLTTVDPAGGNTVTILLSNRLYGTGSTSGAAPLDLVTFALPATPAILRFTFNIVGSTADGLLADTYQLMGSIRTDGATAVLIEESDTDDDEDAALIDSEIELLASANNAVLRVTGVAGYDLTWATVGHYVQI